MPLGRRRPSYGAPTTPTSGPLPKVELHVHVEGAAPPSTIADLARAQRRRPRRRRPRRPVPRTATWPTSCGSSTSSAGACQRPPTSTASPTRRSAIAAAAGVRYREMFFSPTFAHAPRRAVRRHLGRHRGRGRATPSADHGIVCRMILDVDKPSGPAAADELVDLAAGCDRDVLIGIGGDAGEIGVDLAAFAEPFARARAGSACARRCTSARKARSPTSASALDVGRRRAHRPRLQPPRRPRSRSAGWPSWRIAVTACPTSNLRIGLIESSGRPSAAADARRRRAGHAELRQRRDVRRRPRRRVRERQRRLRLPARRARGPLPGGRRGVVAGLGDDAVDCGRSSWSRWTGSGSSAVSHRGTAPMGTARRAARFERRTGRSVSSGPAPDALAGRGRARRPPGPRRRRAVDAGAGRSRCGVSQPFLSAVERGLSMPSIATLYRLAEVLDTTPANAAARHDRRRGQRRPGRRGTAGAVERPPRLGRRPGRVQRPDPQPRDLRVRRRTRPTTSTSGTSTPASAVLHLIEGRLRVEFAEPPAVEPRTGRLPRAPGRGSPTAGPWRATTRCRLFLVVVRAAA